MFGWKRKWRNERMLRALLQQVVLNLLTIIDISLFLVYDLYHSALQQQHIFIWRRKLKHLRMSDKIRTWWNLHKKICNIFAFHRKKSSLRMWWWLPIYIIIFYYFNINDCKSTRRFILLRHCHTILSNNNCYFSFYIYLFLLFTNRT